MLKGVPVSPGVVVARAYCVDEVLAQREPHHLDAAALSSEVTRFESALLSHMRAEHEDLLAHNSERYRREVLPFLQKYLQITDPAAKPPLE